MRKLAAAVLCATLVPASGFSGDHLVSPDTVRARLAEAAAARESHLATLGRVLAMPQVEGAAAELGLDVRQVRAAVSSLSDDELRDLAARAALLEADPVAGLSRDVESLLIIFLLVAIVILVLQAVD
jgi:hypothetical protein